MARNRFADVGLPEDFELVAVTRDKYLRALLRNWKRRRATSR
jgi:hypothetical protein